MKKSIVISALILSSCATVNLLPPSQGSLEKVKSKYPEATLSDLQEGQVIYTTNCTKCHGTKNPEKYSSQEWDKILPRMISMVNKKEMILKDKDQIQLSKYVYSVAK